MEYDPAYSSKIVAYYLKPLYFSIQSYNNLSNGYNTFTNTGS